jgi:hypothetical protein
LNKQFTLADLLRQSVYSRLAGYEDLNDAERLAADPTFRLINSQRIWNRGAADLGATNAIWLAILIAVTKSGAERGSLPECLRNRLRGSKRGASDGQKTGGRNTAAC